MEPPSSYKISILNESGRRAPVSIIRRGISSALSLFGPPIGSVSVLLTTDEGIQALNQDFRSINEPTDVLTFPGDGFPGTPLGDIAISVPYASRQAAKRGVSLSQELGYLAIHGALHLAGYDDETEKERVEMVDTMNQVAVAAGLKPDPDWSSILHEEAER